ncbi:MAG TPA: hypothetical protein VFJ58_15505 [Armatimonadota bacterium]|nr:hypothetical protein [Armatimonadota bacterium]
MDGSYGVPVFSVRIPFWLPGLLIGPLVVGLLIALAVNRLPQITQPRRTWTIPLATAILALVTLFLSGGFFSPADPTHSPAVLLWSCILLLLASGAPFLLPRKSEGPVHLRLPDAARMIAIVAGWIAICGGIAAAAAHWGANGSGRAGVTTACIPLTILFLAAEIGLGMAVLRWTRSHLAAVLVPLFGAASITLLPLLSAAAPRAWEWLYLSPAAALNSLASHPDYPFCRGYPADLVSRNLFSDRPPLLFHQAWPVIAIEIYGIAAVIFFILAIIPRRNTNRASV